MSDVIYNISSGFFDSVNGDRLYSAADMNKPYKRVIADGIFPTPQGTPSTDFQVVAVSGMSVAVLAGNAMIGARWAESADDVGITIAGNSSSSPRIDSIFLHIDTGMETRAAGVVYRQGTAGASPTAPAMVQTDNITELRLADILVAPSAAIITQANITDQRGGSDCPWVAGLIQQVDTSALFEQYRAAYAEQQQDQADEWNTFMDHLARDYDISMSLRKHESTYTSTAAASLIPINIDGYDTTKDLLQVYINGIFAVEGTHYIVKNAAQIQLTNAISAGQKVHFVIYKAVMGGAQPIIPTDEQVQDAVDNYMDAHPGALVVDPELDAQSTHAIQNKAVTEAFTAVNGRLQEKDNDLRNAIGKKITDVTWTDGFIRYPTGAIAASSSYQYSSPIELDAGRIVVTLTDDTVVAVIARYDDVSNRYFPLLAGDGTAYHKQYIYDVTTPGKYVISYRKANGISDIYIIAAYDNVIDLSDALNSRTIYYENVQFASVEGSYLDTNGAYRNSSSYAHTNPLFLLAGVYDITAYATNGVCIAASCDQSGNNRACVIDTDGSVGRFSLNVATAGYYIFSYRITEGLVIGKQYNVKDQVAFIDDKLDDNALVTLNRYKSDLIVPNLSIKAFKTLNYTDGTTDKYAYVLWNDETTDTYYISENLYSERHKAFDWDAALAGYDSSFYQALILPNGDILFVFQTQFVSAGDDTAEGAYRRNPIICRAGNDFNLEIIDFGNEIKPTGWLQNVGAIYSYAYDRVFIAEYTRANEKYARIWAVDMPVTTVSNWHIALEKEIPTPYQTGFKHFHSCQQDPYTGILYFSSGDNDLSSAVWYSTDGGDTLVQLDSYNAGKYRMLNMAFTKEYVYWASDQWKPYHFLWRIERDNNTGVLDVTTLTKLFTFDDEQVDGVSRIATYTTVYMPAYNCLMILDRDDGGIHTKVPVRVYDIPSGNLYTVGELLPITSGTLAGFRNVAITCYTKSNEVACSFDKRLKNNNKLLGNTVDNRINNIVMRLYKSGDAIQRIVQTTWTDGYISNTGTVVTSQNYQYSSPFYVEKGRLDVALTDDTIVSVFAKYDEQTHTYTPLLIGEGTGVYKVYSYVVTEPGMYVISYRKANGIGDIRATTNDASYRVDFDTVY